MTPTLAEITRELLRTYNRLPRKRLGQHFLVDPGVLNRIVKAAELTRDDLVIEIGSGLGVVTSELAKLADHVIAIEIDKELLKISREVLRTFSNITYVPQDILKTDLPALLAQRPTPDDSPVATAQRPTRYKVVGNLPYYITAPIIELILTAKDKPERAVVMVQKEVAERMAAAPGSKRYGSFSVYVQFHAEVKLNSLVAKSSFFPWPEVGSAVVVLKPHQIPKYPVKDEKLFFKLVHAAFQQRRKMLRNSLAKFEGIATAGIGLNRRPEMLSLEEFAALADSCYNYRHEA